MRHVTPRQALKGACSKSHLSKVYLILSPNIVFLGCIQVLDHVRNVECIQVFGK